MTDELRKLATFAYECGLVGSVGNVWHSVTIRDGLTRGRELVDELAQANVELDRLRKQVDLPLNITDDAKHLMTEVEDENLRYRVMRLIEQTFAAGYEAGYVRSETEQGWFEFKAKQAGKPD